MSNASDLSEATGAILAALPRHAASLTIEHNEHLNYYETVEQFERSAGASLDWASEEERQKALASNEQWMILWYPDTPVGSKLVRASTLEACLRAATASG